MIASKSPESWTHQCPRSSDQGERVLFNSRCTMCKAERPVEAPPPAFKGWAHWCTGLGPTAPRLTLYGPDCPHCDVLREAPALAPAVTDVPPAVARSALDVQVGGDHYKTMAIQPVAYIHANGLGFAEGCVVKYVSRWRAKGGVADLKKARHCIDLLIELESKVTA